jgi:hypothetical protein
MPTFQIKEAHFEAFTSPEAREVRLGQLTLVLRDITVDEALMFQSDLASYINVGKPSLDRTDITPPEVLGKGPPRERGGIVDAKGTWGAVGAGVALPKCSVCLEPQHVTPSGMVCKNGHGGAPPKVEAVKVDDIAERTMQVDAAPPAAEEALLPVDLEDLSVFGRLTKLQEIVKELQRRGAKTYEDVLARCKDLKDAEAAPVLARVADLEARLRTCCAALSIPGAV